MEILKLMTLRKYALLRYRYIPLDSDKLYIW